MQTAPDVVVGMGGKVSVPACLAAAALVRALEEAVVGPPPPDSPVVGSGRGTWVLKAPLIKLPQPPHC